MRIRKSLLSLSLIALPLAYCSAIHAARPIDLSHQPVNILHSLTSGSENFEEIQRSIDNNKLHIRLQQTYQGHKVWGAQGILHLTSNPHATLQAALSVNNNVTMDGTFYQGIATDLKNTSTLALNKHQQTKASELALQTYKAQSGNAHTMGEQNELIIFIDQTNKAHWAYLINFDAASGKKGAIPAKPHFIIDAVTLKVLQQWDNIQTVFEGETDGGGFGGNVKMGKVIYDGLKDHFEKLKITRASESKQCWLKNTDVLVKRCTDFWFNRCMKSIEFTLPCAEKDPTHNNVYWNGETDAVNDGYSPSNDALFNGDIINKMYKEWYGVPVLTQNGKPMMLTMIVHLEMDNAYWDGRTMNFGDGIDYFYPLTSLGVAAHEISHGFTTQHSNLSYYSQSGGMNEAFSDMAAQAAEYYAYGKNSWQIGPEIFKAKDQALRYMDQPSKDCHGKTPGSRCSIDDASQYNEGIDVHYSSGVYNRVYYVLSTTAGWNPRKAFDVMVKANSNYWVASTNFEKGACGVIKAAKDLEYNIEDVKNAFAKVKVSTDNC